MAVNNSFEWDLPKKRNFALYYSVKNRFKKILLLDDDIYEIPLLDFKHISCLLDIYDIVGSFIENYPDTSVIGHIQLYYGLPIRCFLSGSYLFVNTSNIRFFFQVYTMKIGFSFYRI